MCDNERGGLWSGVSRKLPNRPVPDLVPPNAGERAQLALMVAGDDDAASGGDFADDLRQLGPGRGVQDGDRFIEVEQPRLAEQSLSEPHLVGATLGKIGPPMSHQLIHAEP